MNTSAPAAFVQGASGGIGLAILTQLLADQRFGSIYASSRHASDVAAFKPLASLHGDRLVLVDIDVTDEHTIAAAADEFKKRSAELSLLINTSGVLHSGSVQPERRLKDIELGNLQSIFSVNAFGPLLVAKHFAQFFSRSERCVLANLSARVASINDNRLGGWYAYRASKAALNMFTKNLAIELQRKHKAVICTALHPGTVDTELSKPFQSNVKASKLFSPTLAAAQLLSVIDSLTPEDNGGFFAWDGQRIPW
ncbi:MAG: SDR family NAD(P)-dependent oxidoreductase [Gammaproteobacteria bacterium]